MPVLKIMRLKPNADAILRKLCFEELEMRGLIPQLSNYDVIYSTSLSDSVIGEIFDGSHEWIKGGAVQVSDILVIVRASGSRYYYRNSNGYVQLEFEVETFEIDLHDGEMLVLVVPPDAIPYPSVIRCHIDDLSSIVGGPADIAHLAEHVVIVKNKGIQDSGVRVNRVVNGKAIMGTFIVCGVDEHDIPCSLTEEQFGCFYVHFKLV